MKETFGQRLCRLRKERSLTQAELAARLSVSIQAVSKWENDQAIPDIALLPELADLLDVSTDTLLGRDADVRFSEQRETDTDDIVARIRILSNDGDTVRINLPLAALGLAKGLVRKEGVKDSDLAALDHLDPDKIREMVEKGCLGDLVHVTGADGDVIHIYLCHLHDKDPEADDRFFRARFRHEEKGGPSEKEKQGIPSPLSEYDRRKAALQKKIDDLAERMGADGEDIDALTKELTRTSEALARLSEWGRLDEQRIEKEGQIKTALEKLRNGEGDADVLSREIATNKKALRDIQTRQERILSQEGASHEDQNG